MITIGLTGVIGSGKSTVAALLRERSIEVLELDRLARDSLGSPETQEEIKRTFGPEYVSAAGVDVVKLRAVFKERKDLRRLEEIVHPRVRAEVERRIKVLETQGTAVVVIEHPLLFETGFYRRLDKIVVVTADLSRIKQRLLKRGMEADDVERRLSFQISLKEKEARADYVLNNNGDEEHLAKQVDSLVATITEWEVKKQCTLMN